MKTNTPTPIQDLEETKLEKWVAGQPASWIPVAEVSIPNVIGFDLHMKLYKDINQWIFENNLQECTFSIKIGDCIYVTFRTEDEYLWFLLKFGSYVTS